MPIYSNKGQYQNAHGHHRRRRRRNLWIQPLLVVVLVCSLVGVVAWATWPKSEQPAATQPTVTETVKIFDLPETVQLRQLTVADSVQPEAGDFVTGLEGTGITVSFVNEPDAAVLGQQTVELRFTCDEGTCTREATLYRFHLETKVTVDTGSGEQADIRDFVPDETLDASFVGITPGEVDHDTSGDVTLTVACDGREYEVIYSIAERIPPVGTAQEITAEAGSVPDPALLIAEIFDDSQVTVTYKEVPMLTTAERTTVTLILTDYYGNTAEVESVINVIPAADAPQFEGLEEIHIQVGDTISYKSGVKAVDAQDGEVSFTVDTENVDRNTEGTYTVYYSATDAEGNTTVMPRKVVVMSIDAAAVEHYAQQALAQIITPDMTRDQQIFAVYKYTKANVQFVGASDKSSVVNGAYEGFTTGKGDCYTYYAMNVIMLDLLGIENLEVTRTGGQTNHWWNLVLHEDGKYYHVDSCPVAVSVENIYHWKMTDTELQLYTDGVAWRKPNFYNYDKTLPEYEGIEIAP